MKRGYTETLALPYLHCFVLDFFVLDLVFFFACLLLQAGQELLVFGEGVRGPENSALKR